MEEKQYKGYLTPTLLNTFVSQDDIMPLLRRDEQETTEAMQNGLDFENRIINGEVEELKPLVNGGIYQPCLFKPYKDYILYGFADLIKGFKIYDFKFVKSYEIGKYRNAVQHLLYMYCADLNEFEYIIGTKDDFIFYEYYARDDDKLFEVVNQFDKWLDITGNRELYAQNYSIERIKENIYANHI